MRTLATAVVVFGALAATNARADQRDPAAGQERLRLTWNAPPGCPTTAEVRAATLRAVDARSSSPAVLEAEAQVDATTEGGWKVRLRTRRDGATGEREIEATTCNGLAEATAVVLALALVPESTPETPPGPVAPPVAAEAPPAPPQKPASDETHAVAVGLSVAGDPSTLPSTAIGGELTAAWTPGRFRLELEARRWADQSQSVSASSAGARFSMTSLGGRACWTLLAAGDVDLSPCGGADVQLVSATGFGADANFSRGGEWVALAGGGLARLRVLSGRMALRSRIDGLAPLTRPTFVVENEGIVHRPPGIGVAASLGIEVLFL